MQQFLVPLLRCKSNSFLIYFFVYLFPYSYASVLRYFLISVIPDVTVSL
jgi:hypothetical protein